MPRKQVDATRELRFTIAVRAFVIVILRSDIDYSILYFMLYTYIFYFSLISITVFGGEEYRCSTWTKR